MPGDPITPSPSSSAAQGTEAKPRRPVALDSLRGEREFRKVRAHGAAVRHPLFTLRLTDYRPRYGEAWRPRAIIGLVVSKKTLKSAVDRNRARRRVREALRTLPPELLPGGLPACRAILLPNPGVLRAPFGELQAALAAALTKARQTPRQGKTNTVKTNAAKTSQREIGNSGASGRVSPGVPDAAQPHKSRSGT